MPPTPSAPASRGTGIASKSTPDVAAKIVSLLESLHLKIDAIKECECTSLKNELAQVKVELAGLSKTIQHPPPPLENTYSLVKKAMDDAATFADKSCRAVWVGREECPSPIDTAASDEQALSELLKELNDPILNKTLDETKIVHHRHPEAKGDRKKRILKISFPTQKIRDHFLSLVRTTRPTAVTKSNGNYLRRDLCPFELELERQARIEAFKLNVKLGGLYYGIRDEKLIKFNGPARPLPAGYESRPPRGYEPVPNSSIITHSMNDSSINTSILTSLTPVNANAKLNGRSTSAASGAQA